jgi:hypothetical protein
VCGAPAPATRSNPSSCDFGHRFRTPHLYSLSLLFFASPIRIANTPSSSPLSSMNPIVKSIVPPRSPLPWPASYSSRASHHHPFLGFIYIIFVHTQPCPRYSNTNTDQHLRIYVKNFFNQELWAVSGWVARLAVEGRVCRRPTLFLDPKNRKPGGYHGALHQTHNIRLFVDRVSKAHTYTHLTRSP